MHLRLCQKEDSTRRALQALTSGAPQSSRSKGNKFRRGERSQTIIKGKHKASGQGYGRARTYPLTLLASQDSKRALHMAIDVQNLSHSFEGKQVLNGIEFSVPRGKLHIILGANGCGKSTLLKILGQLLECQEGHVQTDLPVGMVFQNPDHQVVMPTVAAEVAFGLGRYRLPEATVTRLVQDALEAVGLQDFGDRPTNSLSGGQKQRVAIAGVLALNPKVLLLDELTTFLDRAGQESVMRVVRSAVDGPRRVTAVWVTHRLEELKWADQASFIDNGIIRASGTPLDIWQLMQSIK